jgi:hypothetical protein
MRGTAFRSLTLTGGLGLLLLGLSSYPAAAHSTNGSDAAHYRTRLDGLTPPVPGLTASVDPRGEWIQVTNTTGKTLTILGYAHEPYLRITSSVGVEQNATSPTVTLNQSLFADIGQALTVQAAPQWLPISPGNQARWHDHRIHWMGAARPPAVQAHPGTAQVIGTWTVHMTLDSQPVDLTGTLNWLPIKNGPSRAFVLFLIADVLLLLVGLGAYVLFQRRRRAGDPDAVARTSSNPPDSSYHSDNVADPVGTTRTAATTITTGEPDQDIRAHTGT